MVLVHISLPLCASVHAACVRPIYPFTLANVFELQDKSSSLAVHSMKKLMSESDDVLHVNIGSGISTAHLASLTVNTDTMIYGIIGIKSGKRQKQIIKNLIRLGARCMLFDKGDKQ